MEVGSSSPLKITHLFSFTGIQERERKNNMKVWETLKGEILPKEGKQKGLWNPCSCGIREKWWSKGRERGQTDSIDLFVPGEISIAMLVHSDHIPRPQETQKSRQKLSRHDSSNHPQFNWKYIWEWNYGMGVSGMRHPLFIGLGSDSESGSIMFVPRCQINGLHLDPRKSIHRNLPGWLEFIYFSFANKGF